MMVLARRPPDASPATPPIFVGATQSAGPGVLGLACAVGFGLVLAGTVKALSLKPPRATNAVLRIGDTLADHACRCLYQ